jgi:hypothetical protein
MNRDNHYEAAFEAYLRRSGVAVMPVVEARRSYLDSADVKSPDFLVIGPDDARLVVDVKGRKFPGSSAGKPRLVWECWCEAADLDGLSRWAARLGPGFRGVLAFVYHLAAGYELPPDTADVFAHDGRTYLARAVAVEDYAEFARRRSPRWNTVDLPAATYRRVVRPFSEFLAEEVAT